MNTSTASPSSTSYTPCTYDGGECNFSQYLLASVLFIVALFLVLCTARFLCIFCSYKRRMNENDRNLAAERQGYYIPRPSIDGDTDIGRQNLGFAEPPPRYDQLFKRGGREGGGGGGDAPPPTYEQASSGATPPTPLTPTTSPQRSQRGTVAESRRSQQRVATIPVEQSTYTEVNVIPIEHPLPRNQSRRVGPFVREPREIDIESVASDIQSFQQACAYRYGAVAAEAISIPTSSPIPTGAFGTSYPANIAVEAPPAYDAISLRHESILEEGNLPTSPRTHRDS